MQEMEKPLYRKKGQMGGVVGSVIQLITGVGVAVLVLIFVGALGGQTYNLVEDDIEALTTNVVNDSVTVLWNTSVSMANQNVVNGTVTVLNSSAAVGLGNFTFNYNTGAVTLISSATANSLPYNHTLEFNNTALDFSYTQGQPTIEGHIKDSIVSGFEGLAQTGNYLPVIVLAFVVVFVLVLVLGLGVGKGGQMGGTAL